MTLEDQTQEEYDERFSKNEIIGLIKENVPPELANKYNNKKFSSWDITRFVEARVSPETANAFDERFFGSYEIIDLIKKGFSPEIVNRYAKKFSNTMIELFVEHNILPEKANEYHNRFNFIWLHILIEGKVSAEEANKYDKRFSSNDIVILHQMGIKADKVLSKENEKFVELLKKLTQYEEIKEQEMFEPPNFSLIGTGAHSIVLLRENSAWKFSQNINYEANLLSKLKDSENVVNVKGDVKEGLAVELEYINGKTIEQLCEGDKPVELEKAVKYSAGILNGILEMREVGLYHRDLHDRNILIDEEKDKAIIIDLGSATDNPKLVYEGPRTYYGNNDLVNLGQLMYKMVTGHHLFKEAPGFTFYSDTKENIKTRRTQAYCNSKILEPYLDKVEENVKDKGLAHFIINLLNDDLWTQPPIEKVKEAKEMFERYLK